MMRIELIAFVAGAALACVIAPSVAQNTAVPVTIDNFVFEPERLTVKAGTTVTWTNRDDIPHTVASKDRLFKSKVMDTDESYLVHIHDTGRGHLLLLLASAHDGNHRGRGGGRGRRNAMMLAGRRRAGTARDTRCATMVGDVHDPEQARRFREQALPHLDEVYTLARYLLRNGADAEDAVQECYLRALRHFDTFRGGAIRPWLFAILRNACHASFARRGFGDAGRPPTMRSRCGARRRRRRRRRCLRRRDEQSIREHGERAARRVPRGDRAARDQRPVVSRNRRDRRRAGRHGDVAAGAGPLVVAGGLAVGRGERMHDDMRRSQAAAARAARRRARRWTRARGRGACRGLPRAARRSLRRFREMRQAMPGANLSFSAPAALRSRIEASLPSPVARRRPRRRAARCCKVLRSARRCRPLPPPERCSWWCVRTRISRFSATWCRRICAHCRPII